MKMQKKVSVFMDVEDVAKMLLDSEDTVIAELFSSLGKRLYADFTYPKAKISSISKHLDSAGSSFIKDLIMIKAIPIINAKKGE